MKAEKPEATKEVSFKPQMQNFQPKTVTRPLITHPKGTVAFSTPTPANVTFASNQPN